MAHATSDFTRKGYQELICSLLDRGYQARGYLDASPENSHLILRHDIDVSLQAAEPIAEIENRLGVQAFYFVLLRSEMYNPFSSASRRSLDRLQELGHEIGLHLNWTLYDDDLSELDQAAEYECRNLEAITGASVRIISFHRPTQRLLGFEHDVGGRIHAYQPRFFEEMGYCSDSRGAWYHGHPLQHEAVQQGRALQLLTHPIWWNRDANGDPGAALKRFVADRQKNFERELADNCEPYRDILQNADKH